jgi:hypothetical protein
VEEDEIVQVRTNNLVSSQERRGRRWDFIPGEMGRKWIKFRLGLTTLYHPMWDGGEGDEIAQVRTNNLVSSQVRWGRS